eukprot:SAG22_NODE_96_length_20771_cov_33.186018_13_plen_91_part_00
MHPLSNGSCVSLFAPCGPSCAPHTQAQGSTTHFDVVDKAGNALGCTHSLGGGFGSGVVVPGTGVALNNFLNWADLDPASPACIHGGVNRI